MEVMDNMTRMRTSFICLQETKWVGKKAKESDSSGFNLWYTRKVRLKNEADIIVDNKWNNDNVVFKRMGD